MQKTHISNLQADAGSCWIVSFFFLVSFSFVSFPALRQQVSALSSQLSQGGLSQQGLADLKRAVEAVEASGMKNGTASSASGNLISIKCAKVLVVFLSNLSHQPQLLFVIVIFP